MISKCTIMIPTYNRPKYLKRILSYYNGFEENYNIIIADSSLNKNKEINKKYISAFSNLNILYLDHYSPKINAFHKFADMVNYADREYCVFCADDDFITPNGINQSVTFLEKNPDFSCAQGHYISFYLKINKMVPKNCRVIVCLDSNHTKDHVFKELQLYHGFINSGSYIVVFDTNTSKLAKLGACDKMYINNSPKEAVEDFIEMNDDFEIDKHYNKLYISYSPNGYLRRVK